MKRFIRAALVPVAAAAMIAVGSPAQAITTDASITLGTTVTVTATTLQICAKITFTSGFVPNSTLSLDVAGVENYRANEAALIFGAPTQTDFASTQTICHDSPLEAGSTLHVDYTVEGVGLAPTPFFGSCAGTVTRTNGGTPLVLKSC